MQRHRKIRTIARKTLPHRENGPPTGATTGGPRATPRRGSRPLTNGCGPRLSISYRASARATAPAACFSLARSRGTATGQRSRCLGLSSIARLWRRGRLGARDGPTPPKRGRGISMGAARRRLPLLPLKRPARPLLWRSRPRSVGISTRQTLEDPVEPRRHPLRVVAAVVAVAAIVLIRGLFLRLPHLPGFRSARLQRLALEVLFLLIFLF